MTEKDLIKKIQLLKKIEPRQDWVVSVKKEILGPSIKTKASYLEIFSIFQKGVASMFLKPAFATSAVLIVTIIGLFGLSQNALPGDFLFPLKQAAEKSQTLFASEDEKSSLKIEFANQRVEELAKVTAKSGAKGDNLVVALQALNNDLSSVSAQLKTAKPQNKEVLANKTEELIKKTAQVLTNISGVEGVGNAISQMVESEIKDLETRTLNEEQQRLLNEAKQDFEAGNFGTALEKVWQISNGIISLDQEK